MVITSNGDLRRKQSNHKSDESMKIGQSADFFGRTFWEEWQPCITVTWLYAKTPRSTSGFLGTMFKVLSTFYQNPANPPIFLGGLFGRNGNPALWLCGIMEKHYGALVD